MSLCVYVYISCMLLMPVVMDIIGGRILVFWDKGHQEFCSAAAEGGSLAAV